MERETKAGHYHIRWQQPDHITARHFDAFRQAEAKAHEENPDMATMVNGILARFNPIIQIQCTDTRTGETIDLLAEGAPAIAQFALMAETADIRREFQEVGKYLSAWIGGSGDQQDAGSPAT